MLVRFIFAAICWTALFIMFYCIVPFMAWLFFDVFKEVTQHPAYVIFFGILSVIGASCVCSVCFDKEFYFKE